MIRPSFFIADVTGFVYCKAWGWYYFITNVSYDINGAQYIECELDALGTWRSAILGSKAFIQYSSTEYSNLITDQRITRKCDTTITHTSMESIFTDEDNSFVLFITVGGEYSQSAYEGGYNYYAFSETGWNDFCAMMCNGDFEEDIKKIFTDVNGGLISARRVPIKQAELPVETVSSIRVGRANIPYTAYKLSSTYIHKTIEMTSPNHEYTFQQWSPYTRLKMYIPFIGNIDIPSDYYGRTLLVDYVIDLASGIMDMSICSNNINNKLITLSSEVGGQLPTSVNNVNIGKAITSGASAIGALMTGNVVGAVAEAASAVSTGITDHISNKGTFGAGRSEKLGTDFILYKIYWQPVFNINNSDFIEICGKPCYQVMSLEGLTGYIQTIGFSIDISALDEVKQRINQAMDSGVYLE